MSNRIVWTIVCTICAVFWFAVIVSTCGCEDTESYEIEVSQSVETAYMEDDTETETETEQYTVDIQEYISNHCNQEEGRRFLTVDPEFSPEELTIITDAVDHANEVLGSKMEICGVYPAVLYDGGFVKFGDVYDGTSDTWMGSYNYGVMTIYTDRVQSFEHMRKVLLHELGHYLGASHSEDTDDIMSTGWHGVSDYSDSDIEAITEAMVE